MVNVDDATLALRGTGCAWTVIAGLERIEERTSLAPPPPSADVDEGMSGRAGPTPAPPAP